MLMGSCRAHQVCEPRFGDSPDGVGANRQLPQTQTAGRQQRHAVIADRDAACAGTRALSMWRRKLPATHTDVGRKEASTVARRKGD